MHVNHEAKFGAVVDVRFFLNVIWEYIQGVMFLKYIEFGIGNKWIVRTETELANGTEYEEKGIVQPVKFYSFYIRIWIRKTVLIFDLRQGFKRAKKNRNEFKIIFGIISH